MRGWPRGVNDRQRERARDRRPADDDRGRRDAKAVTASKVALQSVGLRDRPEDLIRELYAAAGPLHAEAAPDEPRRPLEQVLAFARSLPGAYDGATIVARDGAGRIVGSADVTVQDVSG